MCLSQTSSGTKSKSRGVWKLDTSLVHHASSAIPLWMSTQTTVEGPHDSHDVGPPSHSFTASTHSSCLNDSLEATSAHPSPVLSPALELLQWSEGPSEMYPSALKFASFPPSLNLLVMHFIQEINNRKAGVSLCALPFFSCQSPLLCLLLLSILLLFKLSKESKVQKCPISLKFCCTSTPLQLPLQQLTANLFIKQY